MNEKDSTNFTILECVFTIADIFLCKLKHNLRSELRNAFHSDQVEQENHWILS